MYQIAISGSSKGISVEQGRELATRTGEAIARAGHGLLTGATIGLPYYGAKGYRKAGGKNSLGISPATSKVEHVKKYRLPSELYEGMLFTGMNYVVRDALLVNSADAVISIGGRMGTLHEAIIAIETETPIAFILGAGGTSAEILDILKAAGREPGNNIIFGDDPDIIVAELTKHLDKKYSSYKDIYS